MEIKKYNLIGVDDEGPIGRAMVRWFNTNPKFNARYLTNPLDLLEEIKKSEYDIIITDGQMPEMSGLDLLKELKRLNYNAVKVLYSSNYNIMDAAKNEGLADLIFTKPSNIGQMVSEIENYLNSNLTDLITNQ